MSDSPYSGVPKAKWPSVTYGLVQAHPLKVGEIVDIVMTCWNSIFESKIGKRGFQIGKDIHPKPQVMGALLHELIPLEVASRYPKEWRGEEKADDKDLVYVPDQKFSIEIKTSSNPGQIFGNRSFAQAGSSTKKAKSGYYLTVNFGKFSIKPSRPEIVLVRFGWLDHTDWIGQSAETGQQSRLSPETYKLKFRTLLPKG